MPIDDQIKITATEAVPIAQAAVALLGAIITALPGGITRGEARRMLKLSEDLISALRDAL